MKVLRGSRALAAKLAAALALGMVLTRLPTGDAAMEGRVSRLSWKKRRALVWELTKDRGVPLPARLAMAAPALYLVSPLDLMPAFVPVLGRADDRAAFALVFHLAARFAPGALDAHVSRLEER